MRTVEGNLLDMFDAGEFDIIVHGCNCYNSMSGGIAAQIAERYPKAEAADNKTKSGEFMKMGTAVPVRMNWKPLDRIFFLKPKLIINAYTQHKPGRDARMNAVQTAFGNIATLHNNHNWGNMKIGMPEIGCGIGGLQWANVEAMLDKTCGHLNLTVVKYTP